jgi:hypothetical protein
MSDLKNDQGPTVTATQVAQNGVFEKFARAGFVASGILHLIIGYLAIRIALGDGGTADQSGALATLASRPGGPFALWIAAVVLLTLGLWRLIETVLGRAADRDSQDSPSGMQRAKTFGVAVVYLGFAYSTFGFARGAGRSAGEQSSTISARLMQSTAGTIALIAGGIGVVAVAANSSTTSTAGRASWCADSAWRVTSGKGWSSPQRVSWWSSPHRAPSRTRPPDSTAPSRP